jgi:membrane-bound lytic murein transglycosylase D
MSAKRIIFYTFACCFTVSLLGCNSLPHLTDDDYPAPTTAAGQDPAAPGRFIATSGTWQQQTPNPFSQSAAIPSGSIWGRVRNGFSLAVPDHPRVAREIAWFEKHQEYMNRLQDRSQPYLYHIVEEVERRGMPMELALLPAVESAYQPFAYSHGRAAGLWQFIPATGKRYGLRQTWWYDGRRDVVAATDAALNMLQALNREFDGDWELALAAYNAGSGNVRRAIRKNKKKGKPTDFWSLDLPRETRSYVPRLLALCSVLKDPQAHGLQPMKPIADEPYFATVDIEAQLDLALAAEMAGMDLDDLYRLNPGFNRWATDPSGPHRLVIPVENAEQFREKLAQLDPDKRVRWKRYKIQNGDNLGSIARKHDTSVALLRQINKLKGTNIRAGKHLLIPVATKNLDHYALSAEQRKAKILNTKRSGERILHTVRQGETLWEIARKYKVGHRNLAKWNSMAPRDTLRVGQELVVWVKRSSKVAQTTQQPLAINTDTRPPNSKSSVRYRVRKGDSLAKIAQRFNVRVADLKRWNNFSSKYLQPGQRIKLYVDVTAQTL